MSSPTASEFLLHLGLIGQHDLELPLIFIFPELIRMAQSPCLIADLMSYCVCCCLTEVLENCTVEEGVAWREWQVRVI